MKKNISTPGFDHIASYGVFLFWAGIFAIYYFSGDYTDFLNPKFGWLVLFAFILCGLFFLVLFLGGEDKHEHSCCENTHHPKTIRIAILFLPLMFLLNIQSNRLGTFAFEKRAIGSIKRGGRINVGDVYSGEVSKDASLTDELVVASVAARLPQEVTLLEVHKNFEKLIGKKIISNGIYIEKTPGLPEGTWVVFRFLMICCVADAQPFAVLVTGSIPEGIKNEDWIQIEGILEETKVEGQPAPVLKAERIFKIPEPTNPYLTP